MILTQLQVLYRENIEIESLLEHEYTIKEENHSSFFPGRAAAIYYRPRANKTDFSSITRPLVDYRKSNEVVKIGVLGILHPQVLESFKIPVVMSAFELSIEHLE
eukprot:NODE_217_length_14216_cov_0.430545.p11 type:complete len:104 gc:universal NODE_217_length_14216_cov_0.430545:4388-4077(-)